MGCLPSCWRAIGWQCGAWKPPPAPPPPSAPPALPFPSDAGLAPHEWDGSWGESWGWAGRPVYRRWMIELGPFGCVHSERGLFGRFVTWMRFVSVILLVSVVSFVVMCSCSNDIVIRCSKF